MTEKKKRKWDVAGDVPTTPATTTTTPEEKPTITPLIPPQKPLNPEEQVQWAAKQINLVLASQGILATPEVFEKEIEVNHLAPGTRYYLCKGTTHDELCKGLKGSVKTRGKYKPPGDTSAERALHLLVTADTKEDLENICNKIEDIIRNAENRAQQTGSTHHLSTKVLIGMEGSDPQFNVISKLLGPDNSFVNHIQNTSGAIVVLRGLGSGHLEGLQQKEASEAMHFLISASTKQQLDQAKNLAENLLSHVKQEYYSYSQSKNASQYYYQQQQYPNYYGGYGYGAYPGYGYPSAPYVYNGQDQYAPASPTQAQAQVSGTMPTTPPYGGYPTSANTSSPTSASTAAVTPSTSTTPTATDKSKPDSKTGKGTDTKDQQSTTPTSTQKDGANASQQSFDYDFAQFYSEIGTSTSASTPNGSNNNANHDNKPPEKKAKTEDNTASVAAKQFLDKLEDDFYSEIGIKKK